MKITIASLLPSILLFAGCQSGPNQPPQASTTSHPLVLVAGAGGGAAAGQAINNRYGAPLGAVAGLGAAMVTNYVTSKKEADAYQAGLDAGLRSNRSELLQQYWDERTLSLDRNNSVSISAPAVESIYYPSGTVDGVRFGPREGTAPTLGNPVR